MLAPHLPDSLRVLHVLTPGPVGGLERVVQMLTRGQSRAGHDVHIGAIVDAAESPGCRFLEEAAQDGVTVHALPTPHRAYRRERGMTRELFRRLSPQVGHLHGYRADVLHAGVARRLAIPCVTTVHGFTGGDAKNRFYEMLQRRSFRRMEAVVAVSLPLAEVLAAAGVPSRRLYCIPNAWEGPAPMDGGAARERLGVPEGVFHVGFVGRLGAEKGADVFVEALAWLRELPIIASIVGDGPQMTRLKARADQLGLGDRVGWHGIVPDAGRLFPSFDVFVLSSRTEGTPIVLFEAMAAGVPIVATRVGGVPDVVCEDEAILVEPDRPESLAEAIRAVLGDRGAARSRASRARARLDRERGAAQWVERYDRVYARAMGEISGADSP